MWKKICKAVTCYLFGLLVGYLLAKITGSPFELNIFTVLGTFLGFVIAICIEQKINGDD